MRVHQAPRHPGGRWLEDSTDKKCDSGASTARAGWHRAHRSSEAPSNAGITTVMSTMKAPEVECAPLRQIEPATADFTQSVLRRSVCFRRRRGSARRNTGWRSLAQRSTTNASSIGGSGSFYAGLDEVLNRPSSARPDPRWRSQDSRRKLSPIDHALRLP